MIAVWGSLLYYCSCWSFHGCLEIGKASSLSREVAHQLLLRPDDSLHPDIFQYVTLLMQGAHCHVPTGLGAMTCSPPLWAWLTCKWLAFVCSDVIDVIETVITRSPDLVGFACRLSSMTTSRVSRVRHIAHKAANLSQTPGLV